MLTYLEVLLYMVRRTVASPRRMLLLCRAAAGLLTVLVVLLGTVMVGKYIRPSVVLASYRSLPDEQAYYCDYVVQHTPADKPVPPPCGQVVASALMPPVNTATYAGDLYAFGNCTYWAAMRRAQVGRPIPNTWGDATDWAVRAGGEGYVVDHTPTAGAIMQTSAGWLGHVAFVELVDPDGTWHISEMNVAGFNEVDYRTLPASAAADYYFIH